VRVSAVIACFFLVTSVGMQAQNPAPSTSNGQEHQPLPALAPNNQLEIDPAKAADIGRLLDVTGAQNLGLQMMNEMEKSIKPLMSSTLPAGEYRDKLVDLFFVKFHSKIDLQSFRKLAVPVYDKYYSDQEIEGLIEFYSTPLGQKTLSVLPKVVAELQEAGENGEKD
jgi:hypothetical protein